jgi:hypothetical protein
MTADELFRAEYAMAIDIAKTELLPCFCYEYYREFIRDRLREHPNPELIKQELQLTDFERPYLLLNRKERKNVARTFPSYFNKELSDFGKGNRSKAEIERDVAFWLSLRKSTSREGRAAFAAKLRTSLRYLGAYRILQKYRWNRLPIHPADIALYNSQREWIKARKDAQEVIRIWPVILLSLLRTPQT